MYYKLNPGVFTYKDDEKEFVINTNTNDIFLVNAVAHLIIQGVEDQMAGNEIVDLLQDTFPEASLKELQDDFEAFINDLMIRKFIVAS